MSKTKLFLLMGAFVMYGFLASVFVAAGPKTAIIGFGLLNYATFVVAVLALARK